MNFDFRNNRPESLKMILEARDKQREAEKAAVQLKGEENSFQIPFKGTK